MLLFTAFVLVTLFSTITPSSELETITSSIGKETTIEKFPWQVSLVTPSLDHFCGGSIIDETTILTSGECLVRLSKTDRQALYIRAGSTNLYEGGETINAKGIIVHEHFSIPSKQNNDIGLVILNSSLVYTEKIRPVLLPRPMSTFRPNETVFVSGWGSESDDGEELTDQLHFVSLQSIEQRVCRRVYQDTVDFNYIITNKMICAGFPNFDKENVCQSDIGGPLVHLDADGPVQHGIVSWRKECGSRTHPGVYTKVSSFISWIAAAKKKPLHRQ